MEQNTIQDSELEAMRNELQEREDQVLTMSNNFNQATLVVQKLRDSCENLSREKQQCERKLQHFAAMVAQLEAENERLQQLLSDAKSFGDLEKVGHYIFHTQSLSFELTAVCSKKTSKMKTNYKKL